MADEEYIDVSELKTEEAQIEKAKAKPGFGSKLASSFKSAGDKSLRAAGNLGAKGGELVKKGYESYKASQTPEAKKQRYEAELRKVEQQRTLLNAKARLEKAKKSLPQPKQQNNMFGGGMGMGGDMFGSGSPGKSKGGMNNPFGNPTMPGLSKNKKSKNKNMYNPFG